MTVGKRQRKATVEGVKLQRLPGSLIAGMCATCADITYAASNMGRMLCTHCGRPIPEWAWGKLEPVFVPEGSAQTHKPVKSFRN